MPFFPKAGQSTVHLTYVKGEPIRPPLPPMSYKNAWSEAPSLKHDDWMLQRLRGDSVMPLGHEQAAPILNGYAGARAEAHFNESKSAKNREQANLHLLQARVLNAVVKQRETSSGARDFVRNQSGEALHDNYQKMVLDLPLEYKSSTLRRSAMAGTKRTLSGIKANVWKLEEQVKLAVRSGQLKTSADETEIRNFVHDNTVDVKGDTASTKVKVLRKATYTALNAIEMPLSIAKFYSIIPYTIVSTPAAAAIDAVRQVAKVPSGFVHFATNGRAGKKLAKLDTLVLDRAMEFADEHIMDPKHVLPGRAALRQAFLKLGQQRPTVD